MNQEAEPAAVARLTTMPSIRLAVRWCGLPGHQLSGCQLLVTLPGSWIEAALRGGYHVERVASILGLSGRQFLRQSTANYSCSIKELLTHCQMAEAAKKLTGGASYKEVAGEVGFGDAGRFRKRFKEYFGVSPFESVRQRYYRKATRIWGRGDKLGVENCGQEPGKTENVRFCPFFVRFCPFSGLPRLRNAVVKTDAMNSDASAVLRKLLNRQNAPCGPRDRTSTDNRSQDL